MQEIKLYKRIKVLDCKGKGRGVFALQDIKRSEIIEMAPIIILEECNVNGLLTNYTFQSEDKTKCVLVLGYVSLINHSYKPNAYHNIDYDKKVMIIKAKRKISHNTEITINYNGHNSKEKVWFDVKN